MGKLRASRGSARMVSMNTWSFSWRSLRNFLSVFPNIFLGGRGSWTDETWRRMRDKGEEEEMSVYIGWLGMVTCSNC